MIPSTSWECRREGNLIFRNQPSYTYFNKSLDSQDPFLLHLNEIDDIFLQPQQLNDKRAFQVFSLTDPRTQKAVTQTVYDFSQCKTTKTFSAPQSSQLTFAQHVIGVRVLKARLERREFSEDEYNLWQKMEKERLKEMQEFQKFVYNFNQANKEQIYMPTRRLKDLYKKWYERKAIVLLRKYPAETYNTHLGLPHLRVCKEVLKEQWAAIEDVEILSVKGSTIRCNEKVDFKGLDRSMLGFVQDYMNAENLKENIENTAKAEFLQCAKQDNKELPQYFIPFESLMFLLTAGDYVDLPTEMLMDIVEPDDEEEGEKYITMDMPLPARQMGWHTYKQVMEHATIAYLSLQQAKETIEEIKSSYQETVKYELKTFEEFLKSCPVKADINSKLSHTLSKWQLKAKDKEPVKVIYTLSNSPPQVLGPYSIKLEYKPNFGCERLTKYEILQEWLKLKLQKQTSSTCFRLSVNNCQTLLEEEQTLEKLEHQLYTIYHIALPQLLSNLYEFLSLLTTMPAGHYMLRYNPKFKDKFLLCKPSQEITQNTTHLHQLLKTEPSELLFMSQQNFLPIADDLCSLMHLEYNILPCAFRPNRCLIKQKNEQINKECTSFSDKEYIMAKVKIKRDNLEALRRGRKKKAQRKRKNMANMKRKGILNEERELQREIDMDQMILGN